MFNLRALLVLQLTVEERRVQEVIIHMAMATIIVDSLRLRPDLAADSDLGTEEEAKLPKGRVHGQFHYLPLDHLSLDLCQQPRTLSPVLYHHPFRDLAKEVYSD